MQNRIITMCCSICMLIPLVGNASAITVPPDVKDVADSAAELAKGVDYRKRFEQEVSNRWKRKWLLPGQR